VAIIKTLRNPNFSGAAVYEDPIPDSPYIFFQYDAYNKLSLAPQFDVAMNWTDTTGIAGFGASQIAGYSNYILTGVLMLNGETTNVRHGLFNTNNDHRNNLDLAPFASMDPDRKIKPMQYFTDGTKNSVVGVWHYVATGAVTADPENRVRYWVKSSTNSQDLVKSQFVDSNSYLAGVASVYGYQLWPLYRNPSTNNIIFVGQNSGPYSYPGTNYGFRGAAAPAFSGGLSLTGVASSGAYTTSQFVGVGADGFAIHLQNGISTDYSQTFFKYNDSTNTITTIGTFTSAPAGGNRADAYGNYIPKFASKTFTVSAGVTGFYIPYLSSSGQYTPLFFQWDRTADTFTRNSSISVTYPMGTVQNNFWAPDTLSGSSYGGNNYAAMQRMWANETFVYGGTRYLMLMQLHGAGGIYDSSPTLRTFVCYSIDPGDPTALTYHSSIVVPFTPKNIVWLNDDKTSIGIITHNNFYIYNFNGSGWVQTVFLPYQFHAVGRDNLGRIWAVDAGNQGYGRVHMISQSAPVTITVTPDSDAYEYTGIAINANLIVNAYDSSGNRMITAVKLVIQGSSMTFSGSNATTTVTTADNTDTLVAVTITSGGICNVVASAAI
jgi:hypothetical protein